MTGKIFWNLRPHLQIGPHSRKLFSGSTPMPGSPSFLRPIWESLSMKSLGRKFILWTILLPFTGSLGDWRIDWLRKRGSVPMDSTGRMRKASTLSYGTKFCFISDEKTPCVKGEAFEVEHVREGDEHILEGFDHRYKHSRPSATPDSSTSPPLAPPVKSEISEVLNAITMMGQNLQMVLSASQMASRPGPQGFSSQPAGQSDFSRQD